MSTQVSPGITFSETDLTASTTTVSVSDAAFAGPFVWGPALTIENISNEDKLVEIFGEPDSVVGPSWFSAQSFLAYSNLLHAVRAISVSALNSTANAKLMTGTVVLTNANVTVVGTNSTFITTGMVAGQKVMLGNTQYTVSNIVNTSAFTVSTAPSANANTVAVSTYGVLIGNDTDYENDYPSGTTGYGPWVAKYAGEFGNSLKVSVCPSSNAFSSAPNGSISLTASSNVVTGTDTSFATDLVVGDYITANGSRYQVSTISNAVSLTLKTIPTQTITVASGSWIRKWEYAAYFDYAPATSDYVANRSGSNDELHVVVVDEDGTFTDNPGQILERFAFLSKCNGAKNASNELCYYAKVINDTSEYIHWLEAPGTLTSNWGATPNTVFVGDKTPLSLSLYGGQARNDLITDAEIETAYDLFKNTDEADISLVVCGPVNATVASYIIQNICEERQDCIAFLSPTRAAVVNNRNDEVDDITTFRNALPSSSYGFLDSGWKYAYDKYNDAYLWVPLCGDMAGIAARTDTVANPWYSPAGYTRGAVKNVVKLAWNPNQLERDELYKIGVNPVVSFPGQGIMLYGDKTLLTRASAFDRINVRRLFIVLEKTIVKAARAQLFEFNDEYTRSQFKSVVEPYLRDVKSERGITDYYVVCDETNNTSTVIEENRFVGDIYIKPTRAINFIALNFTAVKNGVSFQEVTGS